MYTMSEYLETWLETYVSPVRAKSTRDGYARAFGHLSQNFFLKNLAEVDALSLQKEVNKLAKVYSRQAQILHVGLNMALNQAVDLELIEDNPMRKVKKPKHRQVHGENLLPDEADRYFLECQQEKAGGLLMLMLCLGLRRNEARGLRNEDLDASGILHVYHQRCSAGDRMPLKSESSRRDIPIPEPLRAIFNGEHGEWVCNVSEKALRSAHKRVLTRCRVERHVTLHGLRHTAATLAMINGEQLTAVQQLLGHKHVSLTADLYVHRNYRIVQHCTNTIFEAFRERVPRLEIV